MDRQNGTRSTPFLELFKVRRGHLLKTVGKLNLAHHGQAVALLKLLGNPGLTEKGDLQHARLVNGETSVTCMRGRGCFWTIRSTVAMMVHTVPMGAISMDHERVKSRYR